MTELRTDGPHSPEYTREVGNVLAEAVKVLNYATMGDGIECPADVDSVISAVYVAAECMPQLFGQMAAFVTRQARSGNLADTKGGDPVVAAGMLAIALEQAAQHAVDLAGRLHVAQTTISWLSADEDGDDE
jgi:hypothetical protein